MESVDTVDLFRVAHRPKVLPIRRIVTETPTVKSFYVHCPKIASIVHPGQFVMVWVIGIDEIPMSVSEARKDGTLGLAIAKVGDATSRLHELRKGDLIGVRGPYGNWFDLRGKNLVMVGGGYGIAPLAFCAEVASSMDKKITIILGAEKADELLFRSRLQKIGAKLELSTEDGSAGKKGLATEILERLLEEKKFDRILACGPEAMLKKTFDLAKKYKVPLQVSLERMMKCGIGLCGSCCIGPYRVCSDGPVFSTNALARLEGEFGVFERDSCGRKIYTKMKKRGNLLPKSNRFSKSCS